MYRYTGTTLQQVPYGAIVLCTMVAARACPWHSSSRRQRRTHPTLWCSMAPQTIIYANPLRRWTTIPAESVHTAIAELQCVEHSRACAAQGGLHQIRSDQIVPSGIQGQPSWWATWPLGGGVGCWLITSNGPRHTL